MLSYKRNHCGSNGGMSLSVSERLFREAVLYNKFRSRSAGKPQIKNIGVTVFVKTIRNVIDEIASLGVPVSERTLQLWARQELIPKPETKAAGRGQGKTTYHQDSTPAEGYASGRLIRQLRIPPLTAAKARNKALAAESQMDGPVMEYIQTIKAPIDGVPDDAWYQWLQFKLEAQDKLEAPSGGGKALNTFYKKASLLFDVINGAAWLIRQKPKEELIDMFIEHLAADRLKLDGEEKESFKERIKIVLQKEYGFSTAKSVGLLKLTNQEK